MNNDLKEDPYDTETMHRLRAISLALPETEERPFGGHNAPTYRINEKMFVKSSEDGSNLILKGAPGVQQALLSASPEKYFLPQSVGHVGWIGVNLLTDLDWDELSELIEESYRLIAPKRLVAQLDRDRK